VRAPSDVPRLLRVITEPGDHQRRVYCTIGDAQYLPRVLLLYRTLSRVSRNLVLYVLCMDEVASSVLGQLDAPGLVVVPLSELEAADPDLLAVKPTRTLVEYCWTAKPSLCSFVLERSNPLEIVTYVDADINFFCDPFSSFEELHSASIVVVTHGFPPETGWETTEGIYNAGFVGFRRNDHGTSALAWWRSQSLEWCYDRREEGRKGGQKYLDDWTERFAGVQVLEPPAAGLALWNGSRFSLESRGDQLIADGQVVSFYHYSELDLKIRPSAFRRLVLHRRGYERAPGPDGLMWRIPRWYGTSPTERAIVWKPYIRELSEVVRELRQIA
jgi:hypothetical protein